MFACAGIAQLSTRCDAAQRLRLPRLAPASLPLRSSPPSKGSIPMIDFYALTSPNVQKIYIMLEECGLPYTEHFVDVWKGDQFKPEYLKINPNNKIPAIVDRDGPGGKPYTVFESGAILMYLAEKTGKFMPKDMAATLRRDPVADDPAHRRRADVRAAHAFQAVRAQGRRQLRPRPLPERGEAALRRAREAAWRKAMARRQRIFDRRHRDLPVDAQPRRPGRIVRRQAESRRAGSTRSRRGRR